jgi:polysaccharide biosynthesis/export protein
MAGTLRAAHRRAWLLALAALAVSGCARNRVLKATAMPPEYAIAPRQNAQTIDLSKLATSAVSSELIDRGDVLEVTIETGYDKERVNNNNSLSIRVGEDGMAQVSLIGPVQVAGLELTGAEQVIRMAAVERGIYRNPSVTVLMKHQRVNKVTVVGAVKEPGTYELPRANSGLLAALVAAQGLSEEAGTDIEIRRPALRANPPPSGDKVAQGPNQLASYRETQADVRPTSSVRIDLIAATKQTNSNQNWSLDDGDVVMVERRDPQPIEVIGMVTKPGQFPLPAGKDLHVLDALALAGGTTTPYLDKINLIRRVPDRKEPLVVRISLHEAKTKGQGNLLLGAGDVVVVEQTGPNFAMDIFRTFAPYTLGATIGATVPSLVK